MLMDSIEDVPHCEERIFAAMKASGAPVVLFGAGEICWYIVDYLRSHGLEPVCICDNNPAKHGTQLSGLPIYSYAALKDVFGSRSGVYNLVLSVGPMHEAAIRAQLAAAQEENPIWYLRGYEVCGEKLTYRYVCEHREQFEEAYASLADEFSKEVFVNVLNAKISGDFARYRAVKRGTQYFDDDVFALSEHEVLVDVGAYRGDTVLEFAKRTRGTHDGMIALEPDKATLAVLQDTLAKNDIVNVEIHNMGAWRKHAFLQFSDGREGSSRVSEADDAVVSAASIEVDTIDHVLHGRRASYIVMDIEGAEHNAVLGARETIERWKPRLAVCVYHRREDLFDVLLLLKSFVPGYQFFLRHYTSDQTDTVLYAV
jgi:FkbM family methyltransferase